MAPSRTEKARVPAPDERTVAPNFITEIIDDDIEAGRVRSIVTRFPPEPNGYLHIGHAKAICIDFGVARDYGGVTFLRYDDTNPATEDPEFVDAIEADVRWLGFDWKEVRHASDYFGELYDMAVRLVRAGDAYVDSSDEEAIRKLRGTVTEPGTPSPDRDRTPEENLALLERMRAGEFAPGEMVLRAKIDLSNPNMKMRDPILYRIVDAAHHRTGDEWVIYPMYDFAHPLSDAIEGITHSLCTLEFDNNRAVYDWLVERLIDSSRPEGRPHQYEFARLQLDYTVVSKRKLVRLVDEGVVDGWDDPRMPTLSALRRKGVRASAVREFTNRIGVAKANSRTDLALLDSAVRDDLNQDAPRVMAVLDPLKVTLTNVGEQETILLDAPYWPADVPRDGSREVPLTRELVIERSDFEADPPKGFRRLAPGRAVRLRHGPVIRVDEVVTDASGQVTELRCHAFLDELSENPAGVKVWSAVHWVSLTRGLPFRARLYEPLFSVPDPDGAGGDMLDHLNPTALVEVSGLVEPSVATDDPGTRYQFERTGYFWRDPVLGRGDELVFNRIVALKDSWGRRQAEVEPAGTAAAKPTSATPTSATPAGTTPAGVTATGTAAALSEAEALAADVAALTPADRARYDHYALEQGLPPRDALLLTNRPALQELHDGAVAAGAPAKAVANWVLNDFAAVADDAATRLSPGSLAELVKLVEGGRITTRVGKDLFEEVRLGADPLGLVAERGLGGALSEAQVREAVRAALGAHPDELASYRSGKKGLRGFFVGQVMRATQGRAEPAVVQAVLGEELDR